MICLQISFKSVLAIMASKGLERETNSGPSIAVVSHIRFLHARPTASNLVQILTSTSLLTQLCILSLLFRASYQLHEAMFSKTQFFDCGAFLPTAEWLPTDN